MKKLFAIIALAASAYASAQAQGRVVFPNTFSTKISTNGALGGAATGFVAPQSAGQVFYYAMFASATETTVGGSTAAVIPKASGNGTYVFNAANAGSWFQVERGTNHASGAGFIRCPFETVILGVESLSTAQFVVVGWSANLGTDISQVAANLGTTAGWLGQSVVSGPIETGVHPILPSIFGTAAPAIPGFTLGLVRPSGFGSPIITLNGAAIVTNECHTVFADPGANNSAGFAVSVSGGFGTNNSPDTYVLTYTGTDAFGNVGTTNRIVVERDTLPPVITLLGNNPHYLVTNTPFIDPGATALDLCGGAIAVSRNSPVNPAVEGTYLVSYTAADSSGNAATNFRTVIVTRAPTTLVVTTTNDNGAGSLRDTVSNSVFGDKITFAAGLSGKMILLTNGQITVDRNLTVDASALAGGLMINGSGAGRIFLTTNNTVVTLISLTLTNGRVTNAAGGCLFNSTNCTLNLTNCTLTGNSAVGPNGPNGVGAVGPNCVGRPGGLGGTGTGGGIYNAGTLFLHGSRLSGNSALGGNGGSGANTPCGSGQPTEGGWGGSGGAAQGGAIVNVGSMTLNLNKLSWNIATAGTGGTGGTSGRIGGRGGNAGDSKGGGICNFGTLTLDQNTFASNSVAGGSGGTGADGGGGSIEDLGGTGGSGGSGSGSGIYNAGMLAVNQNTFATNSANGGSGGNGGSATGSSSTRHSGGGGAGHYGSGGGIYNIGLMTLGQNTFVGNTARGGNGGNCGGYDGSSYCYGGHGSDGFGGGIYTVPNLAVNQSTISSNAASGGSGGAGFGPFGSNGTDGSGTGGGIFTSGTLTLTNTIAAGNSAAQANDIAGPFTAVNCLTNLDPRLAPLGHYGGPTPTMPPLLGSPAIDAGSDSAASQFTADQRGFARKVGAHVDIGAVEASFQLVVTTSADSGAGSLRQAIADAPTGYTIVFTNTLSGQTILLTNGQLLLGKNLAIDATALNEGVTISGNNATRIFDVTNGATVSLAGLTIAHGYQTDPEGGVVQCEGGTTLHVSRCTFANNTGGGIWTRGVLLTVDQSTFHGNSSFYGGAVNGNYAPTIISHCTISGNTGSYGGGVFYVGSTLTVSNSIIAGNISVELGDPNAQSGRDIYGQIGTLRFAGANLIPFFFEDRPVVARTGPAPITSAPLLAALGHYGGPTQTMPPLSGSPAIDRCTSGTGFTTDQRGFPRVVDGDGNGSAVADIGAVEFAPRIVTSAADDGGAGTLRTIIANAINGDLILFTNTLSGQTILLTNGQIVLNQNLTIDGSGLASAVQLNGNNASRIFNVSSGANVVLTLLTVTNGYGGTGGGGIYNGGTLTVNQSTLSGNSADYDGGGIYNEGTLTVNQSTLSGNSASGDQESNGGGIYNGGTLTVNQSTLSGNSADYDYGGGIYNGGTLTVNQSTLSGNSAEDGGGGIANFGTLTVNQSTLSGNSAEDGGGGGIRNFDTLNLTNSIVCSNTADSNPNIGGLITSGANNLVDVNALLAPLGNYGGPTMTMPPLPSSPAIDRSTNAPGFATDQRGPGFPSVMNFYADIGAAEALVPSIPNASFEADRYPNGVGYSYQNGSVITGWIMSGSTNVNNGIGLNTNGQPWANNGIIPHGMNVAFLQSANNSTSSVATTISGLTPGAAYGVSFRANGRADTTAPTPSWSLNGGALLPFTAWPPVDASGVHTQPYYLNSAAFVATSNTAALYVQNVSAGDSGVQLDAFTVAPMLVVVTTTKDSGPGSLRQAIAEVASGGTNTFAPHLSGATILLTSGELLLDKKLNIDASALPNGISINGNGTSRVFEIASGTTNMLTGLVLANGYATNGGAIFNSGNLTLNLCSVAANNGLTGGGGIYNGGTLTINQSSVAGNQALSGSGDGGGIANWSQLNFNSSTLSGNSGGQGAGIYNRGTVTFNQSTIANNAVRSGGGGIFNQGTAILNQSTVTGNSGGGAPGIYLFDGPVTLFNCIVADNNGPNLDFAAGTLTLQGNNLTNGPALLAALDYYGGPTPTMPPLPGSPAINTAAAPTFTTDQRGFPRPVGPAPDIGAVEGPVPPAPLIAAGGPWKYLANGSDQGTAWRAPVFDDSAWSNGTARLGFGGDGEAATIASAASNYVTFYFRQSFTVASAAAVVNLFGQIQVDDGVILYLNGTEIYRRNMTNDAGTLNHLSLASFTVANADEQTFWTFSTNSLALVDGVNVLAAEVHQAATNSSDLGFTLDLVGNYNGELPPVIAVTSPTTTAPYNAAGIPLLVSARDPEGTVTNVDFYVDGLMVGRAANAPFTGLWLTPALGAHTVHAVATDNTGLTAVSQTQPFTVVPPAVLTTLVNSNSTWRYLDDGSNQGTLWRTNTYNDAGWSNGVAELGYGDGPALPEATIIRSTGTNGQRITTTYFRKGFTVADPARYSNLVVRLRRDDGGVVYLNGLEIFRSNMTNAPGIPVLFGDLAANAADEVSFFSGPANASLLRAGDNLVAVEIHQSLATSSDVSFDLQLQAESRPLLFISQGGSLVMLNWLPAIPGLELQYAPTVNGPWTPALNQANPQSYMQNPLDPPVFWRLLVP